MAFTVNNATVAQKFYTWADWTGKYGFSNLVLKDFPVVTCTCDTVLFTVFILEQG